jgi:anti-sigma B factor antagonist
MTHAGGRPARPAGRRGEETVMRIDERVRQDIVIIEPRGRLTVETEEEFTDAVRRLLHAGSTRLVLNLAGVQYVDSCGLGAIAQAYVTAWRHGGELKLLNVTGRNLSMLTITKLLTVFEVCDSEDEVERRFGAGPRVPDARVTLAIRHSAESTAT